MVKELGDLCNECRSNSCIEHALGIIEEKRTQENLSEGISNISLTGAERVHLAFSFTLFTSASTPIVIPFCFILAMHCHLGRF